MLRWFLIAIAVLLILLALAGVGGWLYLRTSLPTTRGSVSLPGLDGSVEIVRDDDGIPHIHATTDHDAIMALGYLHAQDRMWQLEMNRRIGNGRLAEVLGDAALSIDKYQRTMGYRRIVEQGWEFLGSESQAALQAYADGVNAWINEGHTLPPEFLLLGFTPEPWTVYDSLVWAKMMAYDLGGDYELEILRSQLTLALGEERAAQILPAYPEDGPVILPSDALSTWLPEETALDMVNIKTQMETMLGISGKEVGSNNWVVGGSRTDTGMPYLADDPHLGAGIPSIWYLAEMQGDRLHAIGATFPGLPLVVIGHNEDIAWGVTNVNPDVQDLYLERINPADPNQVEVNGVWEPMTIVTETIAAKGQEPVIWAARSTRNGPLISDVQNALAPVSLKWTALIPEDRTIDAYLGINHATNWEEFREAMRDYVAPSQNFVYADMEGNIGYFVPGLIPVRSSGDGMLPVAGWNDESAWVDWIPFDQLPQSLNPEQDYIATANNKVVPDEYPWLVSNDWSAPYRAQRIVELIEQMSSNGETISLEDMKQIQADQASAQVRTLLPFLLQTEPADERQRQALALLGDWDTVATMEASAPAIYAAWSTAFYHAILSDDLGGDLYDTFMERFDPVFTENVVSDAALGAAWCDNVTTPARETCSDIAVTSLDIALDDLTELMGRDMGKWKWGDVHQTQYPHRPFSDVAYLKPIFHRSIENGGDGYTVNVAPTRLTDPYNQYHVPSYRHVVDLADMARSVYMTTTGQSGNVLSPHYDDLIERHRNVEYLPMQFGKGAASGNVLTLVPQ